MLDRNQLQELRAGIKKNQKKDSESMQIIVGMGTCGIAAGANKTYEALQLAVQDAGLDGSVILKKTGCMGLCYAEPIIEVLVPGMPPIIYGDIHEELAKDIVRKHLKERKLVDGYIYDRPAPLL